MRHLVAVALLACACKPDEGDDTDDTADVPTIDEALDCGERGPAGGIGAGDALERLDLAADAFPDALCNDGTRGFFYYRPFDGAPNENRWMIQLQGGGSCGSGEDCFARWCSVDTNFGMQGMTATESPSPSIRADGILDRDVGAQNPSAGFNQVFVRYCSSDSWTGTARDVIVTAPHPITGEDVTARMFFEGAAIVDAVLATLRQDGVAAPTYTLGGGSVAMPDLDEADLVVLAGSSGGGAGTIMNGDRVGATLRAGNTGCQGATCDLDYRLLIDSIFSPERTLLDSTHTGPCTEGGLCTWEDQMTFSREHGPTVLQGLIDDTSCVDFHTPSDDLWNCTDNGHVIRNHVTTPMFVRMGLADELISSNVIEAGFWSDGAPMDLETFALLVQEQLGDLTDPANAEEGAGMDVAPGVYGPTCVKHETLSSTPDTFQVTIDVNSMPTRMFDAIADWRSGTTPVSVIATSPDDDFCPTN